MDDLEFRRRILSEPKQRNQDIMDAAANSEANSKFLDDVLALDKQIHSAMNVDVPDDLADRILFNQTSYEESKVIKPTFARRAMAMAASVAFVAGLLVGQINWGNALVSPAQASLADTALKHVVTEKPFVEVLDENVSSEQINTKMNPFAFQFDDTFPYHVYYLNHCGFGKSNAMHMVFQGEKGKVTLFLTGIPSDKSQNFEEDGMSGSITPIDDSSLILVGMEGEDVDKIAEKLSKMIKPMS
ncbi:DUF3379 domain-containing protein [Vibrio pelagius]|uniref:DUF3379 domain-containing protein n=1 Tax=Vibrio pelagius TaxID=28169 RepID=A0ABY5G6X7_VIBPE|nr:DUF3379 domain-containing protein [Vibrio pelagius]UTT85230.1 DUF3379 domain-containing protein [Vibrio pelagius]